jgi:hypothetical protein
MDGLALLTLKTPKIRITQLYLVATLIINVQVSQVPEFEEAAFSAPLNKVVRCKTKFGWHLLQVISERYAKESYSI